MLPEEKEILQKLRLENIKLNKASSALATYYLLLNKQLLAIKYKLYKLSFLIL